MDFLDVLGCIGLGAVISGLLMFACFIFSRRPTETMLCGENVIKKTDETSKEKDKLENPENSSESKGGNWDMTFHVIKRKAYGDWKKAFYFALGEAGAITTFLLVFFLHYNFFKAVGLGALTCAVLFMIFHVVSWFLSKKVSFTESSLKNQYLIFTIITCALSGMCITLLFVRWGLFDLRLPSISDIVVQLPELMGADSSEIDSSSVDSSVLESLTMP